MKHLFFLILLSSTIASSQFVLEHHYNENNTIVRVNLEYSGEKYYVVDNTLHAVMLYNADHTFWKSLPTDIGAYSYVSHLSEAKIDLDANIEMIVTTVTAGVGINYHNTKVVSENGNVLLTLPLGSMKLNEVAGLPDKFIAQMMDNTSAVYSLSGVLEHAYPEGFAYRVNLENSGEKYYLLEAAANQVKLFNADHTPWKTIAVPKPAAATHSGVSIVSETIVNGDPLVELSYAYRQQIGTTYWESKLINENGDILLVLPNTSYIRISSLPGFADKLETRLVQSAGSSSIYYSLPSLVLEHAYPKLMLRAIVDNVGEKYYSLYPQDGTFIIHHGDHTLWKSVPFGMPVDADIINVAHVSTTKVNDDELLEISYSFNTPEPVGFYYECRMINDLGESIMTIPDCFNFYLSSIPGADDKMIAQRLSDNSGSTVWQSTVYSIDGTLSTAHPDDGQQIQIFPNPASDVIHIASVTDITNAELYNLAGSLIFKSEGNGISKIPVSNIPAGFYLLTLTEPDNGKSVFKILVSH